jgi:CoA:oxalate CoA-transferase
MSETPGVEQSALFLYLNTGKKGITLDIRQSTGAAILQRLAQDGGILIESAPPGDMDRLGLGYAALQHLNPRLIYTAVTPFGQTGPYRDYQGSELAAQAAGGMMHVVGLPEREPLKIGGHAAAYTTGMSAFSATMLALHVRDEQGYGQFVDVSAMETMAVVQIHASIQHQFGHVPKRRESSLVRAQEGWVHTGLDRGIAEDTWARVCNFMGQPELADDPLKGYIPALCLPCRPPRGDMSERRPRRLGAQASRYGRATYSSLAAGTGAAAAARGKKRLSFSYPQSAPSYRQMTPCTRPRTDRQS